MENLKPYHPSPTEVGPTHEAPPPKLVDDQTTHEAPPPKLVDDQTTHEAPPPKLVDGEEEFEMEDIITHRLVGPHKQPEYLVRFKGYGAEDNLWLPQQNLEHAPEILRAKPHMPSGE